jgi:hypothetical protein
VRAGAWIVQQAVGCCHLLSWRMPHSVARPLYYQWGVTEWDVMMEQGSEGWPIAAFVASQLKVCARAGGIKCGS